MHGLRPIPETRDRGSTMVPAKLTGRCAEQDKGEERPNELSQLIALWPWELKDETLEGRARVLGRLRRALRLERQRGLAGNWTYDLARHSRLLKAYRRELASLNASLRRSGRR